MELAEKLKGKGANVAGYHTACTVINGRPLAATSISRIFPGVVFIATTSDKADRFFAEIEGIEPEPAEAPEAPAVFKLKKLKRESL